MGAILKLSFAEAMAAEFSCRCFPAILFATLLLHGCGPGAPTAHNGGSAAAVADRSTDDAARFLAGLPGAPGSAFAELESSADWIEHRRQMQLLWKPVVGWLARIGEFERTELRFPSITERTAFYPFSGPDVLFLTALFPLNSTYVMVGLEPPGSVPERPVIERTGVAAYLAGIRKSVSSVLRISFFRTRDMEQTLRGQVTDGVAAPIVTLLALAGKRILSCRSVRLDELGNVVERPSGWEQTSSQAGNRGIKIVFNGGAERPAQTLYYFTANLADRHLRANHGLLRFLDKTGRFATFLKATSYMPHYRRFAMIREQILSRSSAVLQDDSGIPYRFFQDGNWDIQLYGSYKQPIELFMEREQPDLRSAFAQPGVKPLPFSIGYGFGRAPSNLLLAVGRQ